MSDRTGIAGINKIYSTKSNTKKPLAHRSTLGLAFITLQFLVRAVCRAAPAAKALLHVLRLELAMLIIAVRLFDRDRRGIPNACRLLEDGVHFFQGAVARFRVEEVHTRNHEEVAANASLTVVLWGSGDGKSYMTAKMT
mgnify:CR=1 FL=1